jgi:hypothetical protein
MTPIDNAGTVAADATLRWDDDSDPGRGRTRTATACRACGPCGCLLARLGMDLCVYVYESVYVYGSIVESSCFRVLVFVGALGNTINKSLSHNSRNAVPRTACRLCASSRPPPPPSPSPPPLPACCAYRPTFIHCLSINYPPRRRCPKLRVKLAEQAPQERGLFKANVRARDLY